tara:strand:+ start:3603 stop:3818 length:216 start_codon:yes stop_codon:yes gene_type:complete
MQNLYITLSTDEIFIDVKQKHDWNNDNLAYWFPFMTVYVFHSPIGPNTDYIYVDDNAKVYTTAKQDTLNNI